NIRASWPACDIASKSKSSAGGERRTATTEMTAGWMKLASQTACETIGRDTAHHEREREKTWLTTTLCSTKACRSGARCWALNMSTPRWARGRIFYVVPASKPRLGRGG